MPVPWQGFTTKGPTRIGDNVWCGANVVVTSGVTIGERCVIGANSVVTSDIPAVLGRGGCAGAGYSHDHVLDVSADLAPLGRPCASDRPRHGIATRTAVELHRGSRFREGRPSGIEARMTRGEQPGS